MTKVIVIPADLNTPVRVDNLGGLEDYQRTVGGDIETIAYLEDVVPYFNEEGKLLGLEKNARATAILAFNMFPDDYIAGDCIFAGFDGDTGEDLDIQDETATYLQMTATKAMVDLTNGKEQDGT